MILKTLRASLFAFLVLLPVAALAQTPNPAGSANQQLLKSQELDALVAPIALYPDTLLAEVLMASTYPLEVVQADRWVTENKSLKGVQLKTAVDKQTWDDSIKALVATPSVLTMMSTKLDWTQKLGDAVLAQQPDIMDAIQRLRSIAQANNKLPSTKEQKVTVKQEQNKQVIVIEPTHPETVYVPYYDPAVVYGSWPYPDYPPYYFSYPSYIPGGLIASGIAFGAGYALGRWRSGGNYWGGGVNWNNNNININRPVNINNIGNNWQHKPEHRQGVRYTNANVQQKFGNNNLRSGAQNRMDFRGRGGEQVLKPGGGQASLGDRGAAKPGAGQKPSAGQRPSGGRPSARQKPSGGKTGAAQRPSGGKPKTAQRPSGGGKGGGNALGNIQSGKVASLQSARGHTSMGGGARAGGGGRAPAAAARGGRGGRGGGGGGGRGGGGRGRSDIRLKHDVTLLGRLDNGLGFYRFIYNGGQKAYVGVMAQEVQMVRPDAVVRDRDGYLSVLYDKLGLKFQTYKQWVASGAKVPAAIAISH